MDTMNQIVTANACVIAAPGHTSALGNAMDVVVPFRVRKHVGTGIADLRSAPDSASWWKPV